jgi:CubicO group peptidase (beta-lactamase class C family)
MSIEIHGKVAPGFEPVRDAFAENFAERGEIGAAFALHQDGETLVDIHAGHADRKKSRAWQADTLVPVFSTGKAVTALVMAWLVDQGRIAYDTPLAEVWPEFAAEGKDAVTLAQALSHQAGLPGIPDEMEPAEWFDREAIEARLAAMAPMWPLGEGSGYHPITFGFLADAAARRVDAKGRTVGGILREEIAGPRGIDVFIGTPESEHERCAEHALPPRAPNLGQINPCKEAAFLKPWSSPGRRGAAEWRARHRRADGRVRRKGPPPRRKTGLGRGDRRGHGRAGVGPGQGPALRSGLWRRRDDQPRQRPLRAGAEGRGALRLRRQLRLRRSRARAVGLLRDEPADGRAGRRRSRAGADRGRLRLSLI